MTTISHQGMKKCVIGVGSGGCNIVNLMVSENIEGIQFIAMNTDAQALEKCNAGLKMLIGNEFTNGLGTSMQEEIGFKSVESSSEEIEEILGDFDKVYLTACLGGGTGTGGAPAVARISRNIGANVSAIVTKPFEFEGKARMELALNGIEKLRKEVDSLIVISNQNFLQLLANDATQTQAFQKSDRVVSDVIYEVLFKN